MPKAPISSVREIQCLSSCGTRTIGHMPRAKAARQIWPVCSSVMGACSRSTSMLLKPAVCASWTTSMERKSLTVKAYVSSFLASASLTGFEM